MRGQPGTSVNTKHLFFLDVGWGLWPPEIGIQFHMVSYRSAIRVPSFILKIKTLIEARAEKTLHFKFKMAITSLIFKS